MEPRPEITLALTASRRSEELRDYVKSQDHCFKARTGGSTYIHIRIYIYPFMYIYICIVTYIHN